MVVAPCGSPGSVIKVLGSGPGRAEGVESTPKSIHTALGEGGGLGEGVEKDDLTNETPLLE